MPSLYHWADRSIGHQNTMPDNALIESFNGKFRAECLNTHWFLTLDDARQKMEHWRRDYNEVRPHSAIGNKPPISLMKGSSAAVPPEPHTPEVPARGDPKTGSSSREASTTFKPDHPMGAGQDYGGVLL